MANLLPAPYVKGSWGIPKNADKLLHIWFALVFVALPFSSLYVNFTRGENFFQLYGIIYILILAFGVWIESMSRSRSPFLGVDILLFVVTVVGLLGIAVQGARAQYIYRDSIAYTLFMLLRNYTMFIGVPRAQIVDFKRLAYLAEKWLYVGALSQLIATLIFAISRGYTLTGRRFNEPDWPHPNWVAVYAGLILLLLVIGKHISKVEKFIGGGLAIYLLLMMQSRAVVGALILTYITIYLLAIGRDKVRGMLYTIVGGAVGIILISALGEDLARFEPIANMIDRTNQPDPTAGRLGNVEVAIRIWEGSPIFGYGHNAGFQLDNFMAKHMTETGIVGLVLYFILLFVLIYICLKTFRSTKDETVKQISTLAIAFNVFVFFRSFVEATGLFHMSDIMSNAAFFYSGVTVAASGIYSSVSKRRQTAQPDPKAVT